MRTLRPRARPKTNSSLWRPTRHDQLRCSSVAYHRYAPSSRRAGRAPQPPQPDLFVAGRALICAGALALGLALGGCSDEDKERKACPSGGLGVTSDSGKKCNTILDPKDKDLINCTEQLEKFDDYNCTEPQVCPDQGSFRNVYNLDPTWQGDTINFAISNCSVGNQQLTITGVELLGDARCSFSFNFATDVLPKVVEAGGPERESSLIQVKFKPDKLGEDHAALKVTTNAKNIPVLILPICFKVVPKYAAGADSGSTPAPDGGATSIVKNFVCKNVSTTPRSCP